MEQASFRKEFDLRNLFAPSVFRRGNGMWKKVSYLRTHTELEVEKGLSSPRTDQCPADCCKRWADGTY